MVERLVRNEKVAGSIPVGSTIQKVPADLAKCIIGSGGRRPESARCGRREDIVIRPELREVKE